MTKVKMTHSAVGAGIHHAAEHVYELPDHVAEQYVNAKLATREEGEPEVAAHTPQEKRDKAVRKPNETR
ncbi:hypothetical protein [Granulicella tundricola]|uniref:Uncharacterized protein n=1 Tax=Granulicella tundricola (strain ATCC BAA-1859 / DSM 23138 / MP5ACTX9) TaxID=1198114 RepID=E8X0Q7_GRATM|nr:hypothetical protein [Granulicella tundricola]ADW69008.1 hypothetical protein AciX9_1962 [Granulicella tundricola MP5ACTX9]